MATQPFQSLNLGVTPSNANLGEDYQQRDWDIVELLLLDKIRQLLAAGIPISAGDLEIGAVELKNASTDDRVLVGAAGATPTFGVATLGAVANAADPARTEAKAYGISTDLAGYQRIVLKAETTKVIGTINISASQTVGLAAGTAVIGHVILDSGTLTTVSTVTNLAQLGGVAVSMGTGVRAAGTQRVTIATDDLVPVTGTLTGVTTVAAVTAITNALPAGTNLLGKVGIDQTTPGTTNAVVVSGNTKNTASTYSPSLFQNLGANATLNVKASAGNVFSISGHNNNAASRYLQLHNTATVPGGAAVPIFSFLVPTQAQVVLGTDFFTEDGCNFGTGIAFAWSTTRDTYTAATAGDHNVFVQYK